MNVDQALSKMEQQAFALDEKKLGELWEKIRPLVGLLGTIFGKKVRPYIKAFIAAIDALVAKEDEDI